MRARVLRRLLPLLSALVLAAPASARAADATDACIQASDEGQVLRDQGKLLEARARFVTCSRDACPRVVRADCTTWLADADNRIPKVVLSAQDPAGHDTADVTVTLDGTRLTDRLEARAIPVNPGEHHFHFERAGSPPVDETVILREGELRRAVVIRFRDPGAEAAPPPPPVSTGSRPTRAVVAAAVALGGAVAVGGTLFGYFASSAQSDANGLRTTCAPGCNPSDVDAVRTKLVVANTALGVGIAAAVAGVSVLVWGPREPSAGTTTGGPAPSVSVVVGGAPSGGVIGLRGRFW